MENIQIINSKGKKYIFTIYPFEEKNDICDNVSLEGQSVVFISECYETEGKNSHNVLYAVCTNDLSKVVSICDWTSLSEKKANCLGVLLIDDDMI